MTSQVSHATLSELAMRQPPQEIIRAGFDTVQGFDLLQRTAKLFAQASIVPKHYMGNLANCAIAVNMANRMQADPLMVFQNLYVVHGTPTWSAKFMIATFNQCGRFSAIRYEMTGTEGKDDWGCRAMATELATGETLRGTLVTIDIAKKEGWYGKEGSKWKTIPELMLQYRAAAWFVRAYAPEIAMGLQSKEEVEDTVELTQRPDGVYTVSTEEISAAVETPTPEKKRKKSEQHTTEEETSENKAAKDDTQAESLHEEIFCPREKEKGNDDQDCYQSVTYCEKCKEREGCPSWA